MMQGFTRRSALAAMLATICSGCTGQSKRPGSDGAGSGAGLIDVHHHFISPAMLSFSDRVGVSNPYSGRQPWTLSAALADMDRAGVRTAILSSLVEGSVGTAEQRKELARGINEEGAAIVSSSGGRFALFASLPLPSIEHSLAELDYAFSNLKPVGVAVPTNTGDKWLGHPDYDPLFEELNRRKAVVYVHPVTANCCKNLVAGVIDPIIEFGTETGRAIASVIFNGTTTKFPDVRFIFSHAGGVAPFLVERFLIGASGEIVPGARTTGLSSTYGMRVPPAGALAELRRLFYDTAQASNPIALDALRKLVPTSQILFGTDYWWRTAVETWDNVQNSRVFSGEELELIRGRNAHRLIPGLATA